MRDIIKCSRNIVPHVIVRASFFGVYPPRPTRARSKNSGAKNADSKERFGARDPCAEAT